jgi:hypothetical protein
MAPLLPIPTPHITAVAIGPSPIFVSHAVQENMMRVIARATVLACTLGVAAACVDQDPTAVPAEADGEISVMDVGLQQQIGGSPVAVGDAIENVQAILEDGSIFRGRITNLTLALDEFDNIVASGRLIGRLNGERINEVFEDVVLQVLDVNGLPILPNGNGDGVCPILFLELGPIFLDVLGLIVEVPDPIVVEIRAERGPGRLLGNLLCALLGILD